jgi:hypothetical protein
MEFHDDMNPVELLLAYILEHRLDNSLISLSNGYFVLQKILESFNEEEDDSSDGIIFDEKKEEQYQAMQKHNTDLLEYYYDTLKNKPREFVFPTRKFDDYIMCMHEFFQD